MISVFIRADAASGRDEVRAQVFDSLNSQGIADHEAFIDSLDSPPGSSQDRAQRKKVLADTHCWPDGSLFKGFPFATTTWWWAELEEGDQLLLLCYSEFDTATAKSYRPADAFADMAERVQPIKHAISDGCQTQPYICVARSPADCRITLLDGNGRAIARAALGRSTAGERILLGIAPDFSSWVFAHPPWFLDAK